MEIKVYLFDSKGSDKQLDLADVSLEKIKENQLLWIKVLRRDREVIVEALSALGLKQAPLKSILNEAERPKIDIFPDFYRFFILSVKTDKNKKIEKIPIDFLVGKNYVITIHEGDVGYFKAFSELEKGETHIGELDAESFIAALLDLHIVSYFCALEEIEEKVDKLDEKVLQTELETNEFLGEVVELRKTVTKLRRWFLPHRDVFYTLSRPDFQRISESDSAETFRMLNQHFESAVDAIESSRDTVLSLFDLYATKSAQLMNIFIQRLTFLTLIVGSLSVIAGILGMNYKVDFFEREFGFWVTIVGMILLAVGLTILAKYKRWI
ncbi:MAG TPA: magnesium transporter CorA family protein [Pyrinomonadaceae bacterium]|nr:magnesium transporter CorA family protein [Pyrinomonadaceae bacterium]